MGLIGRVVWAGAVLTSCLASGCLGPGRGSTTGGSVSALDNERSESALDPQQSKVESPQPGWGGDPDHLYVVYEGRKAGYMNGLGEIVIEPRYELAWEFYEDRAVVWRMEDGQSMLEFGVIDRTGEVVVPFESAYGAPFDETYREGLMPIGGEGGVGYMDLYGETVIEPQFYYPPIEEAGVDCSCGFEGDPVGGFSEGFAFVNKGHRKFFIDRSGKDAFGLEFQLAKDFRDGHAPFMIDGTYGLIDAQGDIRIEPKFKFCRDFSEGLWPVSLDGNNWHFVDAEGRRAVPGEFSDAHPFSEGLAAVRPRGKRYFVYIDRAGETVFELPKKAVPGQFSEGLVRVQHYNRVIEKNGDLSVSPDGYDLTVFFDTEGEVVIELDPSTRGWPYGQSAEDFSHGLARVMSMDKALKKGYIDRWGNWVWTASN